MLENFSYCPTLHSRVAELKALAQLPGATKDRIFPLIVTRPWPNAKRLARTWEKISSAFGNRKFAFDLDDTKENQASTKPAFSEFNALFDEKDGYINYYDAVLKSTAAIPVLRISRGRAQHFESQAGHIDRLDRGLIVRIVHGMISDPYEVLVQVLERFDDLSIFIDVGWSNDLLGREGWASGIIEHVSRNNPAIELVVTGSSFPASFANIGERGEIPLKERFLYDNLVRRHNEAILIYGDWGSTRPPAASVVMKNIPRIDLPTRRHWISFRQNKEIPDDEDYSDIAKRVITDIDWPSSLNIWGTSIIDWTAKGEPGAIRSATVAAASRINIHLHRQAFFGAGTIISDGDEPFTDD